MTISTRARCQTLTASATLVAALVTINTPAMAQSQPGNYPLRPVRIIVPNTAGSAMDNVSRMIAQRLTEAWGQQVVVDNRPGAGGIIGHEIAAKAAADGYSLLFAASAGVVINPLLAKLSYDSTRDFAPVSLVVNSIQLLSVHPSLAAHTVDELIAIARAKPGQLNCGTPGAGSSNHLACEMLKVLGKVDFVHVPFKGTTPSITGLLSGQVHLGFASIPTSMPFIKAGRLRVLAQGGAARSPVVPNIPTVAETLPGFEATTWYALYVPRATPPAIVTRVNSDVVKILSDPTLARWLSEQGLDPAPGTPAQLTAYERAESERFSRIIKVAGIVTVK